MRYLNIPVTITYKKGMICVVVLRQCSCNFLQVYNEVYDDVMVYQFFIMRYTMTSYTDHVITLIISNYVIISLIVYYQLLISEVNKKIEIGFSSFSFPLTYFFFFS